MRRSPVRRSHGCIPSVSSQLNRCQGIQKRSRVRAGRAEPPSSRSPSPCSPRRPHRRDGTRRSHRSIAHRESLRCRLRLIATGANRLADQELKVAETPGSIDIAYPGRRKPSLPPTRSCTGTPSIRVPRLNVIVPARTQRHGVLHTDARHVRVRNRHHRFERVRAERGHAVLFFGGDRVRATHVRMSALAHANVAKRLNREPPAAIAGLDRLIDGASFTHDRARRRVVDIEVVRHVVLASWRIDAEAQLQIGTRTLDRDRAATCSRSRADRRCHRIVCESAPGSFVAHRSPVPPASGRASRRAKVSVAV